MNRKIIIAIGASIAVMFSSCSKDQVQIKNLESHDIETKKEATTSALLFNGDASLGSSNVWKAINVEQDGSVTTINDETSTLCWKFLKPAGSHRAEGHGAKNYQADEGDDIYIGWTSKLYMPTSLKTDAVFQWKSYPTAGSLQNHPVMLRTRNSKLELELFDSNHVATVPWSTSLTTGTWLKLVLRMKISRNASVGFIEFWYNGVKQTFSNGNQRVYCRTLDSDYCDPKWGVYGGDASQATNIVKKIRIASTYSDAAQ